MYLFQTGMLRLSRDTFFIHPVPDHLTKHVTIQSKAKPHLIYKKSSNLPICQSGILAVLVLGLLSVNIEGKHKNNILCRYWEKQILIANFNCQEKCFAHSLADMEFDAANNMGDINGANSSSSLHKFLQVELLADENVAARHGNDTADFLLVLANIVSLNLLFAV